MELFNRIKPVLCNILEAKGGNDFVEMKRGKKHAMIKLEDVIVQMQKENENNDSNSLTDIIALGDEDTLEETIFADI